MNNLVVIILSPYIILRTCVSLFISAVIGSRNMVGAVRSFLRKRKPTHGDADFADAKKLKALGHFKPDGWLVGVKDGKCLYTQSEACAIGMAPRRSGKSQTAIAQLKEIAHRGKKDDVIVGDAAGDLLATTREDFERAGYDVKVLNFVDPTHSDTYDPIGVLRPYMVNVFDREIDQLCHLLMPDDTNTSEGHFQEFARILLSGTIEYLIETRPKESTLYRVVEILTTDAAARKEMFAEMRKSPDPLIRQAVTAYDEAGERERGSFSTTMARKLKVWLRRSIKTITQTGMVNEDESLIRGWTWEEVFRGDRPTVVFIRTGLGTDEGSAARLILGNAINTRRYMWNEDQRTPERDLRILIDEAVTIGNCQAIVDATNELGKAGVRVMLWFLSMRDVFQTYPNAKTLINNSDLIVFGGGKEMDYYEDVSRMIGEKTIDNKGRSESSHGASKSSSEQARRVSKADELRRMASNEMAVVMGSVAVQCFKPFKVIKGKMKHFYRE